MVEVVLMITFLTTKKSEERIKEKFIFWRGESRGVNAEKSKRKNQSFSSQFSSARNGTEKK